MYCDSKQDRKLTVSNKEQTILQNLLRGIRKESQLSQQELARRLGKPQSFVSKYESGERRLDILELRQICRCVGLSLTEFVARLESCMVEDKNAG